MRNLSARPQGYSPTMPNRVQIVPETFDTMASIMVIVLDDTLDGSLVLSQAENSEKELIAIFLPDLGEEHLPRFLERAWEFTRDPKLVGIYSKSLRATIVRRDFLCADRNLSQIHVARADVKDMTWEQLDGPEPIGLTLQELTTRWRSDAALGGREFRIMG